MFLRTWALLAGRLLAAMLPAGSDIYGLLGPIIRTDPPGSQGPAGISGGRRQDEQFQQVLGLRVRVPGQPGVHRPGLDHGAPRGGEPAEPAADVLQAERPVPRTPWRATGRRGRSRPRR